MAVTKAQSEFEKYISDCRDMGQYQISSADIQLQANMLGVGGIINPNIVSRSNPWGDPLTQMTRIPGVLGTFEVRKVENGFILRFAPSEGAISKEWVADNAEELARHFVQILVESKLDHK